MELPSPLYTSISTPFSSNVFLLCVNINSKECRNPLFIEKCATTGAREGKNMSLRSTPRILIVATSIWLESLPIDVAVQRYLQDPMQANITRGKTPYRRTRFRSRD